MMVLDLACVKDWRYSIPMQDARIPLPEGAPGPALEYRRSGILLITQLFSSPHTIRYFFRPFLSQVTPGILLADCPH